MRRALRILPLALVALLASACVDLAVLVELNDDGSGELTVNVAFDRALIEELSDEEVTAESVLADGGIDVDSPPEGVELDVIDTDEQVGAKATVAFESGEDPAAAIDRAFAALGDEASEITGEGGLFTAFSLRQSEVGGGWEFDATTAGSDEADGVSALFLEDASFVFRLRMPGAVTDHNADRTDDSVLAWDLPLVGQPRVLSARSTGGDGGGGGIDMALVGGLIVVTLVIAGGALFLLRRRQTAPR